MQLVGLAVGVVQGELGVQVVQLAVSTEQEGAHGGLCGGAQLLNAEVVPREGPPQGRLSQRVAALGALQVPETRE